MIEILLAAGVGALLSHLENNHTDEGKLNNAVEKFKAGKISRNELAKIAEEIREKNWEEMPSDGFKVPDIYLGQLHDKNGGTKPMTLKQFLEEGYNEKDLKNLDIFKGRKVPNNLYDLTRSAVTNGNIDLDKRNENIKKKGGETSY